MHQYGFLQVNGNTLQQVETFKYFGVAFTSDETKGLIHKLVKKTQFYVSFISPGWWNGSFQRTQNFRFLNRSLFRSSPVIMNLRWRLKEYCQKNKRQRWDICEEISVWQIETKITDLKSVNPGMSSHFYESTHSSYASSVMYPKCPRKEWRTKSFWLDSTLRGKRSKVCPRTSWREYIYDFVWSRLGVEPADLYEIAVDEVFRVLLGLLPARLSKKERGQRKLGMNECVCLHWTFMKLSLVCLTNVNLIFKYLSIFARNFTFWWKCLKRISHRKENVVDTLKIHHDSLLKTKKKHCMIWDKGYAFFKSEFCSAFCC